MKKSFHWFLPLLVVIFGQGLHLPAAEQILPIEAIDASGQLDVNQFRAQFPGVEASPEALGAQGIFVVYEHEKLRYFFGPVVEVKEARDWEDRLLDIRAEVVAARPSLDSSKVYLYEFTYGGERRWPVGHSHRATNDEDHTDTEAPTRSAPNSRTEVKPGAEASGEPSPQKPPDATDSSPEKAGREKFRFSFIDFVRKVFGLS